MAAPKRPQVPAIFSHVRCHVYGADLVNKYGTYNIQPTADTENVFPLISHALPEQWKDMAIGKDELEQE